MNSPHINVTPLIDVLLVLLIIFMVVAPIKPTTFKAHIPAEPKWDDLVAANPQTLVAVVEPDNTLRLNNEKGLGTPDDPAMLVDRLIKVFEQRLENGSVTDTSGDDLQRAYSDKIERTVFIKALPTASYGSVAKVVDAVKFAGAYPISLQIDDLESGE
jgi:biopolymer transport protein ExbD